MLGTRVTKNTLVVVLLCSYSMWDDLLHHQCHLFIVNQERYSDYKIDGTVLKTF